jgi:hypothetical protein
MKGRRHEARVKRGNKEEDEIMKEKKGTKIIFEVTCTLRMLHGMLTVSSRDR